MFARGLFELELKGSLKLLVTSYMNKTQTYATVLFLGRCHSALTFEKVLSLELFHLYRLSQLKKQHLSTKD
jgi:hypothetical protein